MEGIKTIKYRIAVIISGILLWFGNLAYADTILISDMFSGTDTGSANVSVSGLLSLGATNTASVGPGYTATVNLGAGLGSSLTLAINNSNNGFLSVTEGGLLGVAGSFSASKTFTDTDTVLAANTTYDIGLAGQSNATLALLTTLNLQVTQGATVLANTSTGTGLLGVVNVASLFGSGTTASIQFTTPSVVDTSMPLTLTFSGDMALTALSQTTTFTDTTLSQVSAVPEPSTWALLGLGILGVVANFIRLARLRLPARAGIA